MVISRSMRGVRCAVALALVMLFFPAPVSSDTPSLPVMWTGKLVVAGFQVPGFTELQGRILRETVMRKLHEAGYPVVGVMAMERFLVDGRVVTLNSRGVDALCRELGAGAALFGSVTGASGKVGGTIQPGQQYTCRTTVRVPSGDDETFSFAIAGTDDFLAFMESFSTSLMAEFRGRYPRR
jgi:hypothetical protein